MLSTLRVAMPDGSTEGGDIIAPVLDTSSISFVTPGYDYNYQGFVGPVQPSVKAEVVDLPPVQTAAQNEAAALMASNKPVTVTDTHSASNMSFVNSLAQGLSAAGNSYQAQQLLTAFAQSRATGQPFTIPSSMLKSAQKPASSANSWLIAGGIGLAILAVFAVIASKRS